MKPLKIIILAALAAGATGVANAGIYVETGERTVGTTEATPVQKLYIQGNAGRFVGLPDAGDGGRETAAIVKDGQLYAIDDTDKSYVQLDKAGMEALGKKLNAAMEQVREQLAKMPPEQRAQMEEMLGKQMPGFTDKATKWTVEAIDTGKSDNVDGRACRIWDIKRNGELDEQLCVVPYNALPGKENLQSLFRNFATVFDEMAKNVPMLAGQMTNEFTAQERINGFPVRSRDYENGKLSSTERVMTQWREEDIPASMFQVPPGYKRKSMEDLAGQ